MDIICICRAEVTLFAEVITSTDDIVEVITSTKHFIEVKLRQNILSKLNFDK